MKIFLLALLASLIFIPSALGGNKPQPLGTSWGGYSGGAGREQIEQQSNYPFDSTAVVDPHIGCSWDINSYSDSGTSGYLNPGVIYSSTICQISDPDPIYKTINGTTGWWSSPHAYFSGYVDSLSSSLEVKACYQPQNRCFTASPRYNSSTNKFEWSICSHAIYNPGDSAVVEIPNSNGGHGVITNIAFSVKNLSTKKISNVNYNIGVSSDAVKVLGCPYIGTVNSSYPFTWSVS